jgi:single-strand DNA-binding protein
MINNVVLVGRLASKPELKYTASGMPVVNFRLAVGRGKKAEDGKEETDWLDVVAFQKTAELVAQWLDKGSVVGVEGRVQSRTWQAQDGTKRYAVEIAASAVRFLESKQEAERRRAAKGQAAPAAQAPAPAVADDDADPFAGQ